MKSKNSEMNCGHMFTPLLSKGIYNQLLQEGFRVTCFLVKLVDFLIAVIKPVCFPFIFSQPIEAKGIVIKAGEVWYGIALYKNPEREGGREDNFFILCSLFFS